MKTTAIVLFVLMYLLIIIKPRYRTWYALLTAALYLLFRILPLSLLPGAVNWNVLLMMTGTMILVHFFIDSRMPNRLADLLLARAGNVMWVTIFLSLLAGIISAFIDNVATVLIVAPIGIAISRKLNRNPVAMILSIAVSSNLQGAATMIGDTTSIMLGDYARMTFGDFFLMNGRPGIFFAVELGALLTVPVMMLLFRKEKDPVTAGGMTPVRSLWPTILLLLMMALLIGASFFPQTPDLTNGLICCFLAAAALILDRITSGNAAGAASAIRCIDFETLGLLLGLFVVIGGLDHGGVIRDIASLIVRIGGGNRFLLYSIIVWGSVLLSAFVDNIPYVASMLPVLTAVAASLNCDPYLFYFGLLSGATLGGNITPIGASANITAVGILRNEGCRVTFRDFLRIGLPYTLTAVTAGYLFLWFVWA